METLRIVAFFVVSLCTTFGIAGDGLTMTSLPRPVEVGQADAGKTIALVVGQRLSVRLPYVGGTGYSWTPVHDSAALLTFDGASVTVGQAMPGAASEQILHLHGPRTRHRALGARLRPPLGKNHSAAEALFNYC